VIAKEEIDGVAQDLQVNPADVERDYVFGWLLSKIYGGSPLGSRLVLKGGNALRKGYFPNTRYSGDLDFTTEGGFQPDELKRMLLDVCDAASKDSGVHFENDRAVVDEKSRVQKDLQVLEARLYFHDFYGKPGNVIIKTQMDVTEYERLILPSATRPLIHLYSDRASCTADLRCVALEELLASKLKCLLQRRHVADLFDYAHWLAFGPEQVNASEVLRVFLRKTIYSEAPGAALGLLLGLPFQLIKELWTRHIVCPIKSALGFEDAVGRFIGHLRDLFKGHSEEVGWRGQEIYFPAPIRNVILDAGSRMTLVRMTYQNEERLVEPYSLKFMRLKDGRAREYFYGWKVSGGQSPPGIKRFVASEFQSAAVTDIAFEPRFAVEVSKAGDASQIGTFSTGRRIPAFGITRPRRQAASGIHYMFRCTHCNKRFVRSSFDSTLRPHKRRGGYPCYGTYGSYLGTRF
jgi:predicted nucleotidyltransferase component of viral defense system